jgi:hypothetical protein
MLGRASRINHPPDFAERAAYTGDGNESPGTKHPTVSLLFQVTVNEEAFQIP